jgi:hypothetical protein
MGPADEAGLVLCCAGRMTKGFQVLYSMPGYPREIDLKLIPTDTRRQEHKGNRGDLSVPWPSTRCSPPEVTLLKGHRPICEATQFLERLEVTL